MSKLKTLALVSCLTFVVAAAYGGPLASNSAAMAGWKGTVTMSSGSGLTADVDYAVFAPGTYTGTDPSGGSHYVYAYQVYNNVGGTILITKFSVGVQGGGDPANDGDDASEPLTGGDGPDSTSITGLEDAVNWLYNVDNLDTTEYSTVLLYTSPNMPTTWLGSIHDGGQSAANWLPSPSDQIPEPVTLALAGLALGGILARRR